MVIETMQPADSTLLLAWCLIPDRYKSRCLLMPKTLLHYKTHMILPTMILEYNLAFNRLLKILKYSSLTKICKAVSKTRAIVFILNLMATLEMKELKLGGSRMLDI